MAQDGVLVLLLLSLFAVIVGLFMGYHYGKGVGIREGKDEAMEIVDFTLKRAHTEGGMQSYMEFTGEEPTPQISPEVLMAHGVESTSKLPEHVREHYSKQDYTLGELLTRR